MDYFHHFIGKVCNIFFIRLGLVKIEVEQIHFNSNGEPLCVVSNSGTLYNWDHIIYITEA